MQTTTQSVDGCLVKINPGEASVSITIQENEKGKFGNSKTLTLSHEELQMTLESYQGDEEQFFKDLIAEAKSEREKKSKHVPKLNLPKFSLPSFSQLMRYKQHIIRAGIFVVIVFVSYAIAGFQTKEEKIARLQEEIIKLRSEVTAVRAKREQEYQGCQDQCMENRTPYDKEVLKLLDEIRVVEGNIGDVKSR